MAEHIVVCYLAVLIDIMKYIENLGEEVYLCDIKIFERKSWKNPNRYYNYADVRKLRDGVSAEMKLEGKRITPEWYINQVISKHYYEELLIMYEKIDFVINKYIPEFAEALLKQNKNAGAMIVFAKYSEVRSKVRTVEKLIDDKLSCILKFHKEKSIVWKNKPKTNITKKFDIIYKGMLTEWCKCTSFFVLEHWNTYEKYPDILGACVTYLCDILVEAIVENEFDTFASNYKSLFGIQLLYQEYSRKELVQIKEKYRQSAVFAVFSNPIIEYSMISGYAYMWGEISGDNRWKTLILEDTKSNITKDDMAKKICEILYSVRGRMPSIYHRDILHTSWCRKIENAFKSSEKLSWKRDMFYEVYGGDNKLLGAVLSEKNDYNFMKCAAYEIYAVVVLNQFLEEENRYRSCNRWEDKYYD